MKGCANGVVLFSMGSMVRAASMDTAVRDSMIDILGRLDECVLWKWEETIERLPRNIRTVTWLPQADVLGEDYFCRFLFQHQLKRRKVKNCLHFERWGI